MVKQTIQIFARVKPTVRKQPQGMRKLRLRMNNVPKPPTSRVAEPRF